MVPLQEERLLRGAHAESPVNAREQRPLTRCDRVAMHTAMHTATTRKYRVKQVSEGVLLQVTAGEVR